MALLSDLWWYNGYQFYFLGGSMLKNTVGRYPADEAATADEIDAVDELDGREFTPWPGSRLGAAGWWSSDTYRGFIFGGRGCDRNMCTAYSYLNDLWAGATTRHPSPVRLKVTHCWRLSS